MASSTIKPLQNALDLGLGIVSRVWDYRTKDWVTNVFVADVDKDGETEVIACVRDGRMHVISSQAGDLRWTRIIGTKAWVETVAVGDLPMVRSKTSTQIMVGTRDGKVFMLDKDGKTLSKNGEAFAYDTDGRAFDQEREREAYWYDTEHTIRHIVINPQMLSNILIGSEDRCAHALDYETGGPLWKLQTNGWVRTISVCDIDEDGQVEILAGSADGNVYLLDQHGHLLNRHRLDYPIYGIVATDVDQDGRIELLVTTEGNELIALVYHKNQDHSCSDFEKKWCQNFSTRLLSFCVTDIDGDGSNEIIASSDDKYIYILDAQGNTIWRHNHRYRVFSIFPHDIDNDGLPELILGSENNRVRAMRIRLSRGVERRIRRYYQLLTKSDPAAITELTANQRRLLEDIIQPNARELVTFEQASKQMQEGFYESALLTLLKLEQQKVEPVWYKNGIGQIRTIAFRQSGSEKKREIIVGTADGTIHCFHPTGRRSWFSPLNDHLMDMQVGRIDHHRWEEILTCSTDDRVYILSGATKPRNIPIKDASMASICITTPTERNIPEIVIGSEGKKLLIYSSDLQTSIRTIHTQEGIKIVRAYVPSEGHDPEIVTASLGNSINAYSWHGKHLWSYEARDHIKALRVEEINKDGRVEILVGSEDRNIHVLDSAGHLLWRYLLPHSILAIDAADADNDGEVEVLVGCADGYLYVFSKDGDLLWTYHAKDRIRASGAADIDGDGNIEIVVGSENELELMRFVNRERITLLIAQCWSALHDQSSARGVIQSLLDSSDPFLQAFALNKLVEQDDCTAQDFDILEKFADDKDCPVEVGKALVHVTILLYPLDPSRARALLYRLWTEGEQDVRNALIEHVYLLISRDWELGFQYLKRASENVDRFMRRIAVRKLHQLLDTPVARSQDGRREIFRMLLATARDKETEWVRQEAARALAHYLDRHHQSLITYTHLFIVKGLYLSILKHIAHATTTPIVKNFMDAIIQMVEGLNEDNVSQRILQVIRSLEGDSDLNYGKDLFLIYTELHHLFMLKTIDEIANYQCALRENQFDPNNQFARIILQVFNALSQVGRPLKMYSRRESIQDRLASLLETITVIDRMPAYVAQKFATELMGEPITRLPNRQIFLLLLENWRKLVLAQLNELRGNAELHAELLTKDARNEEQVGIWLNVMNTGRSSASEVKITLLHSEDFETVNENSHETEMMLPQEDMTIEFTVRPHCKTLNLAFEITYNDVDAKPQLETLKESLELIESNQVFRYIPNPYSTGTPTHDSKMFYGREKEMAYLRDNLVRKARSVVVLYGQRRSGKTSMLLQLNKAHLEDHIPVFIDLQGISYYMAIETLLYEIALAVAQALEQKDIPISSPALADFEASPFRTLNLFLNEAEKQLAGRRLILLIDEFEVLEEQVAKKKLRAEIFEYLRDIVQHRQSISFLFSGTHKITEHTKWYRSVFFQIALHYPLSRLNSEGAEDLIKKPVEGFLEYDPLAVKKIRQQTADQPYLIHLVCRAAVDYCNDRGLTFVTINIVNTVLQEVMETSQYHFDWLWDQINPDERMVLAAIAEGGKEDGRWLSSGEVEEIYRRCRVPYKNEYIQKALRTLVDADIIENMQSDGRKVQPDRQKFRIPVGLTRTWLLSEHPVEQVCRDMVD